MSHLYVIYCHRYYAHDYVVYIQHIYTFLLPEHSYLLMVCLLLYLHFYVCLFPTAVSVCVCCHTLRCCTTLCQL